MKTYTNFYKRPVLFSLCLLLTIGWFYRPAHRSVLAQSAQPATASQMLFLPLVANSKPTPIATPTAQPTTMPTATAITTPPAGQTEEGAWFMEPYTKTGGADIQVDLQGGLHLAYRYHLPDVEGTAAAYLYCPPPTTQCADMQQWHPVKLLNLVREVQLELTADGRPRLLIQTNSAQYPGGGEDYHYAECNQNCNDPQQWQVTLVATRYGDISSGISSYYLPDRYCTLDAQGRSRFVYNDRNYVIEPDHLGAYYLWCDADCTQQANWQEVRITQELKGDYVYDYEGLSFPALTLTKAGAPRVVGDLVPLAGADGERNTGIYYFACDTGCESSDNWQRVKIADRGQGPFPMWDVALDANDRPHVAFYKEDTLDDDSGKRLHYLQCDNDCLNAANWQMLNLGLPREAGDGADLALDANGRPRITYLDGRYDLGYSWCNGECLQLANWQHGIADTETGLEAAYPIARPLTCDAGLWRTHSPAMMLDAKGNPHIAYDASYKGRCLYKDPNKPDQTYYEFIEIWHAVRVLFFPQP